MAPTEDAIIAQIQVAFGENKFPGDWCLRGSNEGDEPYLLDEEFKGKDDWRTLDAAFLDQAPGGFASALSFFSDEAFRFYLPAYLIADLQGQLRLVDVLYYLCHGLDESSMNVPINPRRYGARTWYDEASYRFSMFTKSEVRAIVAYLEYKRESGDPLNIQKAFIDDALSRYWSQRASKSG
jgi:hypothetical protein